MALEEIKKYILRKMIKPQDFEDLFLKLISDHDNKLALINSLTNYIIKRNKKLESKRLIIFGQCALRLDDTLSRDKSLDSIAVFFKDTVIEIGKVLGKEEKIDIENEEDEEPDIDEEEVAEPIKKPRSVKRLNNTENNDENIDKKSHIIIPSKEDLKGLVIKNNSETLAERATRLGIRVNDSLGSSPIIKKEGDQKTRTKDVSDIARKAADNVKSQNTREDRNLIK